MLGLDTPIPWKSVLGDYLQMSKLNLLLSYINNKYKKGDKEFFQRFNGNPQSLISFKVK